MPRENPLRHTNHRPWPLPRGSWLISQWWRDLLFAHWRVPADSLQRFVPAGLELDTFDGSAWLGVVPFRMTGIRLRCSPPVLGAARLPELNVRTYVRHRGQAGVVFLTLDTPHRLAVWFGRRCFHLPYRRTRIRIDRASDGVVRYRSSLPGSAEDHFDVAYRPVGAAAPARPGELEHFLAERYCLLTTDRNGCIRRADVHHVPWRLQQAEAEIRRCRAPETLGLPPIDGEPVLHYSRAIHALIWPLRSG